MISSPIDSSSRGSWAWRKFSPWLNWVTSSLDCMSIGFFSMISSPIDSSSRDSWAPERSPPRNPCCLRRWSSERSSPWGDRRSVLASESEAPLSSNVLVSLLLFVLWRKLLSVPLSLDPSCLSPRFLSISLSIIVIEGCATGGGDLSFLLRSALLLSSSRAKLRSLPRPISCPLSLFRFIFLSERFTREDFSSTPELSM